MSERWPDPRFRTLSRELLAGISVDEIGEAVVQHVQFHRDAHPDEPRDGIDTLPPGVQAIYATWLVDIDVNNGGFNQFFLNRYAALAGYALSGYELLGTEQYASIMRAAIAAYESARESPRAEHDTGPLTGSGESHWHDLFDEIDRRYYSLGDQIYSIWAIAVHDRPALFVRP